MTARIDDTDVVHVLGQTLKIQGTPGGPLNELDLPPGTAKLKQGGGHGGHNGLRDIIPALGNNKDFYRLRIGIGHPGHASKVTGYVLGAPSQADRMAIDACIDEAIATLPLLLEGDKTKAMTRLHSFSAA